MRGLSTLFWHRAAVSCGNAPASARVYTGFGGAVGASVPPASESEHQPFFLRPTPRERLRRGSGAVKAEGDFAKQTRPPHSAGLLV